MFVYIIFYLIVKQKWGSVAYVLKTHGLGV